MYTQESPGQGQSAARGHPDPALTGSHSWRDVGEPSHTSLEPRETVGRSEGQSEQWGGAEKESGK